MEPKEATAKIRGKLNLRGRHIVIAILVALIALALLSGPRSARAYEYSCGSPPAPLTTVEKLTGVTVPEGRKVFIGRGIAGDGTGLGDGNPITEVPRCTSNDPLFIQEGNLLVTIDESEEMVYFISAVVAYLDGPLAETSQP